MDFKIYDIKRIKILRLQITSEINPKEEKNVLACYLIPKNLKEAVLCIFTQKVFALCISLSHYFFHF